MCMRRRTFFDRKQPFDTAVCQKMGWTNFLFANNQLPNGGCMNTTWSLAVQMQFYAVLPLALLILRPRTPGFRWALISLGNCRHVATWLHHMYTCIPALTTTEVVLQWVGASEKDPTRRPQVFEDGHNAADW